MKTQIIFIPKLSQEITFLIGTNAQDNVDIICNSNPTDIWFHVADYPSAHIIAQIPLELTNQPNKILLPIIKQGAVLCKQVSKYSGQKNLSITYTCVSNVKPDTNKVGTVSLSTSKNIII